MSEARHTPGPWEVDEDGDISAERDGTSEIIASTYGFWNEDRSKLMDTPEMFANANLIGASPDMFAALQDCLLAFSAKNLKTQQFRALAAQAERKARAALAKAEGR